MKKKVKENLGNVNEAETDIPLENRPLNQPLPVEPTTSGAVALSPIATSKKQPKKAKKRCTTICLKFINIVLLINGCLSALYGLLFLTIFRYKYEFNNLRSILIYASLFLIFGVILIVLSVRSIENRPKVFAIFYLAILSFILIVLVAYTIFSSTILLNGKITRLIRKNMRDAIKKYNFEDDDYNWETKAMDWTQAKFSCCGVQSYTDWSKLDTKSESLIEFALSTNPSTIVNVPDSCCFNSLIVKCGRRYPKSSYINLNGCYDRYYSRYSKELRIFIGFAVYECLVIGFCILFTFVSLGLKNP
jgi:hypothetical protein